MTQVNTSANTSINSTKLPKVFSFVKDWKPGTHNFDFGAGKFDNATEYLKEKGVTNLTYDPYNRSEEHNQNVLSYVVKNDVDTVTCNNVLNVIDSERELQFVVYMCAKYLKKDGTAYFQIYEGDKSGVGKVTKADCYQRNQKTVEYLRWVKVFFNNVSTKGNIIIAKESNARRG